jgi:hypothetical protein
MGTLIRKYLPKGITFLAIALMAVMTFVQAAADGVYHSEHIALASVGGAPLQNGFVENIHVNGPQVYAMEQYVLNGAIPDTDYQVSIQIYYQDPSCSTSPLITLTTAAFRTNASGNGNARAVYTPADAAPLRGMTHGAVWEITSGSTIEYQTACSAITLD